MADRIPALKTSVETLRSKLDDITFRDQSPESITTTVSRSTGCVRPSITPVDTCVRPCQSETESRNGKSQCSVFMNAAYTNTANRPEARHDKEVRNSSRSNINVQQAMKKSSRKTDTKERYPKLKERNYSKHRGLARISDLSKHSMKEEVVSVTNRKRVLETCIDKENKVKPTEISNARVDIDCAKAKPFTSIGSSSTDESRVDASFRCQPTQKSNCYECGAVCVCGITGVKTVNASEVDSRSFNELDEESDCSKTCSDTSSSASTHDLPSTSTNSPFLTSNNTPEKFTPEMLREFEKALKLDNLHPEFSESDIVLFDRSIHSLTPYSDSSGYQSVKHCNDSSGYQSVEHCIDSSGYQSVKHCIDSSGYQSVKHCNDHLDHKLGTRDEPLKHRGFDLDLNGRPSNQAVKCTGDYLVGLETQTTKLTDGTETTVIDKSGDNTVKHAELYSDSLSSVGSISNDGSYLELTLTAGKSPTLSSHDSTAGQVTCSSHPSSVGPYVDNLKVEVNGFNSETINRTLQPYEPSPIVHEVEKSQSYPRDGTIISDMADSKLKPSITCPTESCYSHSLGQSEPSFTVDKERNKKNESLLSSCSNSPNELHMKYQIVRETHGDNTVYPGTNSSPKKYLTLKDMCSDNMGVLLPKSDSHGNGCPILANSKEGNCSPEPKLSKIPYSRKKGTLKYSPLKDMTVDRYGLTSMGNTESDCNDGDGSKLYETNVNKYQELDDSGDVITLVSGDNRTDTSELMQVSKSVVDTESSSSRHGLLAQDKKSDVDGDYSLLNSPRGSSKRVRFCIRHT